jgi:hypothetical protein
MRLKKLYQLISDTTNYGQWLFVLFPSLGAAVSVWSTYVLNQPWYIILFYGGGVFAFIAVATEKITSLIRYNAIVGKIRIEQFYANFGKLQPNDQKFAANCSATLHNMSNSDLFYQQEISSLSLDGRSPLSSQIDKVIFPIQSGATTVIHFASIADLTAKSMTGSLHFKIIYGKQKDALNHSYELRADPHVSAMFWPNGELSGVGASLFFKDIKYE